MVRYEIKKLIPLKLCLIILLLLLLQSLSVYIRPLKDREYSETLYRQFCEHYEGIYDKSIQELLLSRKIWIDDVIAKHDETQSEYHLGRITLKEFSAYMDIYTEAMAQSSTVNYLLKKCEYYDSLNRPAEFFCDTQWLDMYENDGFDYLLVFAVMILCVPAFTSEYAAGSRTVLMTTPGGREKTAAAKLIICTLTSFFLTMLFRTARLVPVMNAGAMKYAGKPAYDLLNYPFGTDISLIGAYESFSVMKALEASCMASFICLLSVLVQNRTFVYFLSAVLLYAPAMMMDYLPDAAYVSSSYAKALAVTPYISLIRVNISCMIRIGVYVSICIAVWRARYVRREI